MAETDWTVLSGSLDATNIDRGVTTAVIPPPGGGSTVLGFNSLTSTPGACGFYKHNGFPTDFGTRVTGAIKRHTGPSTTGWSSFLIANIQGVSVSDQCYMLGLDDSASSGLVLRKGLVSEGIRSRTVGADGVLAVGSASYGVGEWIHIQLDAVTIGNGDVVIICKQNDIDSNDVDAPIFTPIPGMDSINPGSGKAATDDSLHVASGNAPLIGGFAGIGFEHRGISRRSFFDYIQIGKQT